VHINEKPILLQLLVEPDQSGRPMVTNCPWLIKHCV